MRKCVFIITVLFGLSVSAQISNDSLKLVWENEKGIDSVRFNALENYYEINNQTQPDSALVALEYYYLLAEEKKATKHMFKATKRTGNIYRLKRNYDKAMSVYQEAETLAIELKDPTLQAAIMGNMGNIFIYRQDYSQATQYFSKALKFYQEDANLEEESHMLTSLGSVYLIINNYDLALEYYKKSLNILNNRAFEDRRTAVIYLNIGWTNFEKGLYKDAEFYYKKGLKILQVKNEKFFIANCYESLAKIYLNLKDLKRANFYAIKNLDLNTELAIETGIIDAQIIIAQLTFETNTSDATKKAEAILAKLPSNANNEVKRNVYELLYKCYKAQNKLGLSLKMYERYNIYNDSIQLEKNNFAVAREAVKNEFDVKLYETKLKNEKQQAQLELKQLKRTFGIISGAVLLILFIVLYYKNHIKKNRKKREALLEELEKLKNNSSSSIIVDSKKFELIREDIEASINRKLNETDWKVLNILLDTPEITNKEIAEKAFMSVDGIGSALRRMYDYFDIKDTKYKKIALLTEAIKRSNN
ncbi:tetratricopeptide repeat protein [Lacinutrix jangbogonensis]|uniref:tetratricopeptide repeat protein n=1 Tax=Lacinutrix jangbogonensis TaxID=1469557 RepID=UPI00053DFA18|nr:tetratricopeptide repeat protein [Lacinutrix jangbogonensis]